MRCVRRSLAGSPAGAGGAVATDPPSSPVLLADGRGACRPRGAALIVDARSIGGRRVGAVCLLVGSRPPTLEQVKLLLRQLEAKKAESITELATFTKELEVSRRQRQRELEERRQVSSRTSAHATRWLPWETQCAFGIRRVRS